MSRRPDCLRPSRQHTHAVATQRSKSAAHGDIPDGTISFCTSAAWSALPRTRSRAMTAASMCGNSATVSTGPCRHNPSSACRLHGSRSQSPDGKEVLHESRDQRSACHDTPKLEPARSRAQTPSCPPSETLKGVGNINSIPARQGIARVRSKRRCSTPTHAPVHARLTPQGYWSVTDRVASAGVRCCRLNPRSRAMNACSMCGISVTVDFP